MKGKEGHFIIHINGKEIHLKCENNNTRVNWIKSLNFFKDLYKNESKHAEKKVFEEVDLETIIRI